MIKKIKNIIILVLLAVMFALISAGITIIEQKNSVNAYAFDYGFDYGFGGPELPDGTELPSGPSGNNQNDNSSGTIIKLSDLFSYNQDVMNDSYPSSGHSVALTFHKVSWRGDLFGEVILENDLGFTVFIRSFYLTPTDFLSDSRYIYDGVDKRVSAFSPFSFAESSSIDFKLYIPSTSSTSQTLHLDVSIGGALAPTISYDSNERLLSWSMPDFSGVYYLYKEGVGVVQNSTATSYTTTESGRYKVMALGTGYIPDSDYSDYVTVDLSLPTKLLTPILTYNSNTNILSWNDIENAIYYIVRLDQDTVATTSSNFYGVSANGSYTVQAIAQNSQYNSDVSYPYVVDSMTGSYQDGYQAGYQAGLEAGTNSSITENYKYSEAKLYIYNNNNFTFAQDLTLTNAYDSVKFSGYEERFKDTGVYILRIKFNEPSTILQLGFLDKSTIVTVNPVAIQEYITVEGIKYYSARQGNTILYNLTNLATPTLDMPYMLTETQVNGYASSFFPSVFPGFTSQYNLGYDYTTKYQYFDILVQQWDTLTSLSMSVNSGYNAGYATGRIAGRAEGFEAGKADGYELGKNDGYVQAVNENLSGTGILAGAFAFIKLLFNLTGEFLAKPLAGDITIGLILIGLPATFFILNGVISLILKLFGK